MKQTYIIITAALILIASIALAARPGLQVDGLGIRHSNFAPDGAKNVTLTVNKQTVDMRNDIGWSAYTPTACKFRAMSTATIKGTTQTLPANTRTTMHVNAGSAFINFTGCTTGELLRQ